MGIPEFKAHIFDDLENSPNFHGLYVASGNLGNYYANACYIQDNNAWLVKWFNNSYKGLPVWISDCITAECWLRSNKELPVAFLATDASLETRVKNLANNSPGWLKHSPVEHDLYYPDDPLHFVILGQIEGEGKRAYDKWFEYLLNHTEGGGENR